MSDTLKIEDLEKSLIQRANDLAEEYRQRAKHSYDQIIKDENDRMELREEREIMAAKMLSERIYRSQVQSNELKVQKQLDQLRWQLIKNVIDEARKEIISFINNPEQYMQLLIKFIDQSAQSIDEEKILVEFNQTDYQNVKLQWQQMCSQIKTAKTLQLSSQFHHLSGGIIVYNQARTQRIDNTFEGRMERLSSSVHQLVAESFFSELSHETEKIHGR